MKRYAYAWITLGFFLVSFGLHWLFGWYAYVEEATEHHQVAQFSAYLTEMGRMNGGEDAEQLITELDEHYLRKGGHAQPHGHEAELAKSAGRGLGAHAG